MPMSTSLWFLFSDGVTCSVPHLVVVLVRRNLDEKEFAKCMKEQKLDLTEPEVMRLFLLKGV